MQSQRIDDSSSRSGSRALPADHAGKTGFTFGILVLSWLVRASAAWCVFLPLVLVAITPRDSPNTNKPVQTPSLTKLAEGEYAIHESENGGAVGPFGEEAYNFHESFTLSRDAGGGYEVDGVRNFESPKYEPHSNRFRAELERDFTLAHVREFAKLRWVPDSGPLSCDFLPTELDCSSGGSDPRREIKTHTPLEHPYGLLWPISPFSFASVARQVERNPRESTLVDLVRIEQPGMANPVRVGVLEGPLRYLGEEDATFAGKKWRAHKFTLKVATNPEFVIWTSPRGLLLGIAVQHDHPNWKEEGIRLDRLEGPGEF
jgi:hypothetical protein